MKFRFIGEEASEIFGFKWFPGTEHDVNDPHAVGKLKASVLFEEVKDSQIITPDEPAKPAKQIKKKTIIEPVSDHGDDPDHG